MKTIKKHGKNWIQKGVISVLIGILTITPVSGITLAGNTTPSVTNANTEAETSNIIEVDSVKDLKNNITNTEVDALVIEGEKKKVLESSLVQEYLDDGVNVFVEGDCKDEVKKAFDEEINVHHGDNEKVLGYHISSDGEDNICAPVSALFYTSQNQDKPCVDVNTISDTTFDISEEDILNDMENNHQESILKDLPKSDRTALQATKTMSDATAYDKSKVYVFAHTWYSAFDGCVDKVKKSMPNEDWKRIATFDLQAFLIKCNNIGTTAFDYVVSKAVVTPYEPTASSKCPNDINRVRKFNIRNTIINDSNNKVDIFDSTLLTGNQGTESVAFGFNLGADGISFGSQLVYSYKPQGASINRSIFDYDTNLWTVNPNKANNDFITYEVQPTAIIETRKKNTTTAHVRIRMTRAEIEVFSPGIKHFSTYGTKKYIFDTSNNGNYITLSFKNHKGV